MFNQMDDQGAESFAQLLNQMGSDSKSEEEKRNRGV